MTGDSVHQVADHIDDTVLKQAEIIKDRGKIGGLFPSADVIRLLPFTLEKLPYHVFAIAVLFDENPNGLMDKSRVGFPLEGFGFSRNPCRFLVRRTTKNPVFCLLRNADTNDNRSRYSTPNEKDAPRKGRRWRRAVEIVFGMIYK